MKLIQACIFFSVVAMNASSAIACLSEDENYYRKIAITLSPEEVCGAIASGITKQKNKCDGLRYDDGETIVTVTRRLDNTIIQFDAEFIARSSLLSGIVGDRGYESHKFRLLLFLTMECKNALWRYAYEPRFIVGSRRIASDLNNPNWHLYSNNDRIQSLSNNFETWIKNLLIRKIREEDRDND